jgi:hypothetical protein
VYVKFVLTVYIIVSRWLSLCGITSEIAGLTVDWATHKTKYLTKLWIFHGVKNLLLWQNNQAAWIVWQIDKVWICYYKIHSLQSTTQPQLADRPKTIQSKTFSVMNRIPVHCLGVLKKLCDQRDSDANNGDIFYKNHFLSTKGLTKCIHILTKDIYVHIHHGTKM